MYTHEEIWIAIDRLAKASGHSTSGLAIKAGLDPTSFNKSKRFQPNKKPRWPSMESISKILSATQTTMDEFIALIQNPAGLVAHKHGQTPLIPLSYACNDMYFTQDGHAMSDKWDKRSLTGAFDAECFAFEIDDNTHCPLYRLGDILIIAPNAELKTKDRAVFKLRSGEVILSDIIKIDTDSYHIAPLQFADGAAQAQQKNEILWHGRIEWLSQ